MPSSVLLTVVTVIEALMSYDEVTTYNDFGSFTELETNPTGVGDYAHRFGCNTCR
ncbi:hypothetical protein [Seramator thermalis]|uniref:hypothetical protein n=1 Tax=Seramator thermalis TaxID=2496270 RepID=UPI0013EBFC80|nr:hypothetical protein [Seramator thermalis]